ncbi:MAG TPA: lysylphosphatidylglycerol synthase domain-containing protein [Patescibacteria group bacterium]|nr:lysylphosphatidylglycerol synthase domain-containing protein [Patescibacteria group bacterium]
MGKIKLLLRFILGLPLTIFALYFVFRFISAYWPQVSRQIEHINYLLFVLGLIVFSIFFLFRCIVWDKLLEIEGYDVPLLQSIYILSLAEIKRYIPGNFVGLVSRLNSYNHLKISISKLLKMVVYESTIFFLTSLIISIPGVFYLANFSENTIKTYLSTIGIILLFLFMLIIILIFISKQFLRGTKDVLQHMHKYKPTFIYMVISWCFYGLGNFLIAASINHVSPMDIISISSFFVLAWVVGYVVIIAPLGLGVREAFVTYGLAFLMPIGIAASIAVITRVAMVISELIFLAGSYLIYKSTIDKKKKLKS